MFCGFVPDCPRSATLRVECRDEKSTMIEGLGRLPYQNVLVGPRSRTGDSRWGIVFATLHALLKTTKTLPDQ